MEENLPPGFRFHPTDEELITYYLTNKVSDFSFSSRAITDVDLNKCEPWDLPAKASMGEKEWYFFSLRDRKYPTGMRTNRATEAGYWKTTGKDKEIFRGGLLVGMKKTLVFYKGRAPKGEKTNWVMHEYRLEAKLGFKPSKEEWVVCRIFQKSSTVKKLQQTPSSPHESMESPYCDTNTIMIANELGDIELPNSSSSGVGNIISPHTNFTTINDNNLNLNTHNVLNWSTALREAASALPSLTSWPPSSSFLNPTTSPVSPLLLRALQLSTYQSPAAAAAAPRHPRDDYTLFMPQGINNHFGNDLINISSNLGPSSSSRVNLDQQQEPHPHSHHQQEQPFNLDSDIW